MSASRFGPKEIGMDRTMSKTLMYLVAGATVGLSTTLMAEPEAAKPAANAGSRAAPQSGRENLLRLQKFISVDFNESKLEDVLKFFVDNTGVELEPLWKSSAEEGLDKEMLITLSAKNLDALTLLEKVLSKASGDALNSDEKCTWQIATYGSVQVGPRKALNRTKRLEVYDVSDLLFEVPVYDDAPTIDLTQTLQNGGGGGGGGGGGSNPFGNGGNGQGGNQQRQQERRTRREDLANELKRLITSLAEKDQWEDNGGTGGTITVYQGNILVDAPDYMHRALAGYLWWPATRAASSKGRRYVTMSTELGISQLIGLIPFQETAATPGGTPTPNP